MVAGSRSPAYGLLVELPTVKCAHVQVLPSSKQQLRDIVAFWMVECWP